VKHPRTNGKLERFFGEYKRHRHAFSLFEYPAACIGVRRRRLTEWYRPHGSLEFESLRPRKEHFEGR
jgi:putative transposase